MDPRPVSSVVPDKNLPAPHGVPGGVSNAAVDDDFSFVHRVADGVLGVGLYSNRGPV